MSRCFLVLYKRQGVDKAADSIDAIAMGIMQTAPVTIFVINTANKHVLTQAMQEKFYEFEDTARRKKRKKL
jgi:hypothetical protein